MFQNRRVVEAAKKDSHKFNKTKLTMMEWGTAELKFIGAKDKEYVSWKTSNYKGLSIIERDKRHCVLHAYEPGTYTITAKCNRKLYKCKVTVKYQPKGTINGTITSDDFQADAYLYLIPQNANLPTYTEKQFRYALSESKKR
ncbi:hypothetical protein [Velocimicrobium porci]|uniref:Uncharacterized protein n=1 Tax=Velocimicrobium porci TaxID=2606634 RepID=A0A6L5Y3C6_9FIRM|nr:hypothetical protein [Velocimicrobium porci]MSS64643.1 hypothetical protein [Velocimicrobium porci]